jgi:hypothetical protein
MGIPSDVQNPAGQSSSDSSRDATPEPTALAQNLLRSGVEGLQGMSNDEVIRLLGIYQEEVACVHPIIETKDLIADAPHILEIVRNPQRPGRIQTLGRKDTHILRLAIATAITHEIHGKNDLSDRLVYEVEQDVGRISSETEVELKDIQIMGMLVSALRLASRGIVIDHDAEFVLLPHRRRAFCMARNWKSLPSGFRNGSASQTELT